MAEGGGSMKLSIFGAVVAVLFVLFATRSADARPGAMCFSDANCDYQEICIKDHSYDPYGHCIRGSR
jgi:hypothetical protein